VAKVLNEILDRVDSTQIPALLPSLLESVHGPQGVISRLLRTQTLCNAFLDFLLKVILEFLIQFRLNPPAMKQGAQPQWP
jgi:hypothetical protein